jgi:hypothetical protein
MRSPFCEKTRTCTEVTSTVAGDAACATPSANVSCPPIGLCGTFKSSICRDTPSQTAPPSVAFSLWTRTEGITIASKSYF